ncbi:MAG TPA: holo-[acyl-carrier-protein] synthase [Opitutae bacterium]|nr:holo-[acyl-carrier-protein] synthase [Opitutaceae bacterium]HCR30438.1 holo-[acyl-carrier-protein] synthase [Opitutae bacterium]
MTLDFALPPGGPLIGIGIDIVEIARIKDLRERQGERFLHRVYTESELQYCMKMKAPDQHLAARFAAKEAITKAFTVGIGEYFDWKSVGVVGGERRQPEVELDEKGKRFLERVGVHRISLSLSHSESTAIAVAAIIGHPQPQVKR